MSGIKNTIENREVFDFKERYCNENTIIANIIRHEIRDLIVSPVLDVGAGTGDIAYHALQDFKVILIDSNPPSPLDFECRALHQRITSDFFTYSTVMPIGTLLISHALQFIDEDLNKLNSKIKELSPQRIVSVVNANNDFMGELISWTDDHFQFTNPERYIEGFPAGYKLIKSFPFTANLVCPTFEVLAEQVSYLMLIDLAEERENLVNYLKTQLQKPEFTIRQFIHVYTQHHG